MRYKRVVVTNRGGPEVLQVVEEELPEPGVGDVRVRILAAGVSYADLLVREGVHPEPAGETFTPGWDLVGVVDSVGDGVSGLEPGQMVAALPVFGGYAESICLPPEELIRVPPGLDPAEAVSLVLNYVTAYQMLHRSAQVGPSQRVLIDGAAGGCGTALLQLGRLVPLEMYGTASQRKHPIVSTLGASTLHEGKLAGGLRHRLRRLASIGLPTIACYDLLSRGVSFFMAGRKRIVIYSIQRLKRRKPEWFREDLTALLELLRRGSIKPIIAERIPLTQVRRAHELLGSGSVTGKIVLLCSEGFR